MHERHDTMKKRGVLFFAILLCFTQVFSQRYSFKNYTTHDGLVQTDITDIKQDKKGAIWIGTNGGISVFDGKKFTNYDDHDLLQSLRINALLCDSNGTMWIATANGLLRYQNKFEVFFKPVRSRDNPVTCLSLSSQNCLVFACNKTLYTVTNGRVATYAVNNKIEHETTLAAFDRNDNLWIVTASMKVYKKTVNGLKAIRTFFTESELKAGLGFLKLLGREGPEPYFVTNFGTYCVRGDSLCYFVQQYPQYRKAGIGPAVYVREESDTALWVGGVMGLSKLTPTSVKRYTSKNGFCDNSVSCLFTDREKNLWIGCTYNGVYRLSNEALFHIKPVNETYDLRHVSDLAPLSADKTLIATWGKGLYLYDHDSVSRVLLPPSVRYITSLAVNKNSTYIGWFGKGLWRLDNATGKVSPVLDFAKDESVGAMYKTSRGYVFQMLDYNCYATDFSFAVKAFRKLPEQNYLFVVNDKIYEGSMFGRVDLLGEDLKPLAKNLFPEISSRVTQIAACRNYFLVGTFGQGLFIYDDTGKLIKKLDKKTGLATNIVTGLTIDENRVFIGSNLGLIKADLPDLSNVKVFTESEGMFTWECRQQGLMKLSNGSIFVATTNGPYVYFPEKDLASQYASAVLTVAGIDFGDNASKPASFSSLNPNIVLSKNIDYQDNNVVITLNGVSQRDPDNILYHYQLSGYDSMWVTTSNPVITANDLTPGAYKLKAYLSVGSFQSKPLSVAFFVAKPLSGQLWFQVLLVLILSGLCWILLTIGNRIYQKYIQAKMIGKLESDVAMKQEMTAQSIAFARQQYRELSEALRQRAKEGRLQYLTPVFLKDVSQRIELLWKKETFTLGEFHQYFDDLLSDYDTGAKLYHKLTSNGQEMPVPAAFQLLEIFSLYLFIGLYESGTAVFSLDSENKSNGQLLMRLYNMTHEMGTIKSSSYHLLKEAISHQRPGNLTVDVIENLEFGNMLIAELNLHNEN